MSLDAQDWVWEHSRSKGTARLVILVIADKASGPDCSAYAGTTFLMKRVNAGRTAVVEAVDKLLALGEVEIVRGRRGPRGETCYRLPKAAGHKRGGPESGPVRNPDRSGKRTGAESEPPGVRNPDRGGPESGPVGVRNPDPITQLNAVNAVGTHGGARARHTSQAADDSALFPVTPPAAKPASGDDDTATTAQTLVAEWIERCTNRPPGQVIGQISKHIKTMLGEGIQPDHIRRGLADWMTRDLHPSTLPSLVNSAMNTRASSGGHVRPGPGYNGSGSHIDRTRPYSNDPKDVFG